ncbi:hypothetical protein Tco_0183906 [Tanacetum coccineum]
MAKAILSDNMEKAPTESNISITSNDINIKLSKEFLVELRKNIYHVTYNEDVVDHIAKVLKMVDLIYVPGVDSHQLRMKVFPLSLADDAKEWWISEGDGKITTWEEHVEKLFCDLDNSTSNVLIPLDSWTSGLLVYKLPLSVEYGVSTSIGYGVSSSLSNTAYSSQLINTAYPLPLDTAYRKNDKGYQMEFKKIKDGKVEDVPLTCDTSLEVFNNEVSRLSRMDDDLFTYEVEVANIPCDSKMDNDSEQEADDDMGYDPSDVAFIEWLG